MAKKSTKTKSRTSPPKHIWKTILISALAIVLIPTILLSIIIIPELYESHKARERYERIPKAQAIDDFISYQIPSGWTKDESWIIQDPDENKRHQYITLLSPEYISTKETGCHFSISARISVDPTWGLQAGYYVNESTNNKPYGQKEIIVDDLKAVSFYEDFIDHKQTLLIAQPNPDPKNRRLWAINFLCGAKDGLQKNKQVVADFINSIKFK